MPLEDDSVFPTVNRDAELLLQILCGTKKDERVSNLLTRGA